MLSRKRLNENPTCLFWSDQCQIYCGNFWELHSNRYRESETSLEQKCKT